MTTGTLLLVILIVLLLLGAVPAYGRRADWGPYPMGGIGLIVLVLLILLILRVV